MLPDKRIHFVVASDGWVLERMAHNFAERIPGTTVSDSADYDAACNVYFPYYMMTTQTQRDICLYTHLEDVTKGEAAEIKTHAFHSTAKLADVCWAMSDHTAQYLPQEKTEVIKLPPDPMYLGRKLKLGCVGIDQPCERKNFSWIETLRLIPGVEVWHTNGKIAHADMPVFYQNIDYLVILSNNEGGPMPVLEAMACGTPVIAPDVGWAWEYPCFGYAGIDELVHTIRRLIITPDVWDNAASRLTALCLETDRPSGRSPAQTMNAH